MHVKQLGEIVPTPGHNTVGVCHQVTFLILHYITSRLVPLLKVIDALIQVPNVLDLTVILPVVLYGCETWSLTLREEMKLRVFENKVLRRIFGPPR